MSTVVGTTAAGVERQPPDQATLATQLAEALGEPGLRVLERQENARASTALTELVCCELPDGRRIELFCKYGVSPGGASYGHRGGVEREAGVYRDVLAPLGVERPRLYGSFCDEHGVWLLAIEYLTHAGTLAHPEPEDIELAASWIGRFHERSSRWLSEDPQHPLAHYDGDYYRGWAERTLELARQGDQAPGWLPKLVHAYGELVATLDEASPVVVHGEYYPANILKRFGQIHAVDWESAALAAGEVDLAAITEGWGAAAAAAAVDAYGASRWDGEPDHGSEERLGAAYLYLSFRWLGGRAPELKTRNRFDLLRRTGEELGLI